MEDIGKINREQLFDFVDQHFLAKLEYPQLFTEAERQVEGWFKGELIYLFSSLKANWEPEASIPSLGKKKIDFRLRLDDSPVYAEIKALYHGRQRGQVVDLGIYFYKDNVGIWGDVQKLASVAEGHSFCILFIYPRPEIGRWHKTLAAYGQRIAPITLGEVSEILQFPPELYIAKLEVSLKQGLTL
ncbi:MAG TPA: hypothetical protein VMX96_08235 [Dehalococcoidia bacterium]|nr:hypothetical protein [Dehalococcoidia bacterium]